jgi:hypothetical protein
MIAGFHDDLRVAFQPAPKQTTLPLRSDTNLNDNEEGFTEIDQSDFDSASVLTPATTHRMASRPVNKLDSLPDINSIERPEDLMKKPPYHLIVQHSSYSKEITVQCSHQASLDLMSEYFKRWVKRNHNQTNKVCKSPSYCYYTDRMNSATRGRNINEGILFWTWSGI